MRIRTHARTAPIAILSMTLTLAAAAENLDMSRINAMDRASFVQKFGGVFENSPWVADQTWDKKPFTNLDEMHSAMVKVAKYALAPQQIALLQSHPDLAGKEARAGAMTASSASEQAGAGLNALSPAEMKQISELSAAYKKKFGLPFIIAAGLHTKEGILFEFNRRLANDTQTEFDNDLQSVYRITRLRLNKMLGTN